MEDTKVLKILKQKYLNLYYLQRQATIRKASGVSKGIWLCHILALIDLWMHIGRDYSFIIPKKEKM